MDNAYEKRKPIDVIVRRVIQVNIVKSIEHHVYHNHVKIMENVLIVIKHLNVNVHLIIKENSVKNPSISVEQHPILVFVSMVALVKLPIKQFNAFVFQVLLVYSVK
jgi:hypothetical protein